MAQFVVPGTVTPGYPTDPSVIAYALAQQDALNLAKQISKEFTTKLTLTNKTTQFNPRVYKNLLATAVDFHPMSGFIEAALDAPHCDTPEELWKYTKDKAVQLLCVPDGYQPLYNFFFQRSFISAIGQRFNYQNYFHLVRTTNGKTTAISLPALSFAQLFPNSDDSRKVHTEVFFSSIEQYHSWEPRPEPLIAVLHDYRTIFKSYFSAFDFDPNDPADSDKPEVKKSIEAFKNSHMIRFNTCFYTSFPPTIYVKYFSKIQNPLIEPAFRDLLDEMRNIPITTINHLDLLIEKWAKCSTATRDTEFTQNNGLSTPMVNLAVLAKAEVKQSMFSSPAADKAARGINPSFRTTSNNKAGNKFAPTPAPSVPLTDKSQVNAAFATQPNKAKKFSRQYNGTYPHCDWCGYHHAANQCAFNSDGTPNARNHDQSFPRRGSKAAQELIRRSRC